MTNVGCNMATKGFYDFMSPMNCACKHKKRKYLLAFNVEPGSPGHKSTLIFPTALGPSLQNFDA